MDKENMNTTDELLPYLSPTIKIVEVEVELGFMASNKQEIVSGDIGGKEEEPNEFQDPF